MDRKLVQEIRKNIAGKVFPGEALARHTTYRVGGKAGVLVCPRDADDAARVFSFVMRSGIPCAIIGAGSNIIAPDEGIDGVVIKTMSRSARIIFLGGGRVRADAGVPLLDLVRATAGRGLTGLEPLAGIPGTVGGAAMMNAGTENTEIAQFVSRIEVVTAPGRTRVLAGKECAFGYRRSVFLGTDWFVLSVEFKLGRGNARTSLKTIDVSLMKRESKYHPDIPSAGSVFKRPPGDFAGRLIEEAGCKGMRVGDAVVADWHANFIVNAGHAKAREILELVSAIRSRVFETSGVYLELEQIPLSVMISAPGERSLAVVK
jgi:UDP-N-acetylmuramate dehydrogenase